MKLLLTLILIISFATPPSLGPWGIGEGPLRAVAGDPAVGTGPDVASKPRTGASGRDPGPVKPTAIDRAHGSPGPGLWPKLIRAALRQHRESAQLKKHYDRILMLVKEADRSKGIWTRLFRWTKRPCSIFRRDASRWGLCFSIDTMAVAEACNLSATSFSETFLAVHQNVNALKDETSVQQCLSTLRRHDKKSRKNSNAEYHWLALSVVTFPSIWALCTSLTTRHQAPKGSTVKCLTLLGVGLFLTTPVVDSWVAVGSNFLEEHLLMRVTVIALGPQFASDLIDLFRRARSVVPAARTITFLCSGNIVFLHEMLQDFEFPARKKITIIGGFAVAAVGAAVACSASYHASEGDRDVIYLLFVLMALNGVLLRLLPPRHEELFTWGTTSHISLMVSYFTWLMGLTAVASVSMNYSFATWLCRGLLSLMYLGASLAPLVTIARGLKRHVIVEQPRMIRRRSF